MINDLFNEKRRIVLSPHYDDLVLSLGGLALKWTWNKCPIEDWVIFSNSAYTSKDTKEKINITKERIKIVSAIRLQEELNVAKKLGNIKVKICNLDEAPIRGYNFSSFMHQFNPKKDKMFNEVKSLLLPLLSMKNVQIFAPLAIKGHIDHLIIREAIASQLNKTPAAQVFFYEDIPYTLNADKQDIEEVNKFIKISRLAKIVYPIDLRDKLKLVDFYKSQKTPRHYRGIIKRAKEIQYKESNESPCEKIYAFPIVIKNKMKNEKI